MLCREGYDERRARGPKAEEVDTRACRHSLYTTDLLGRLFGGLLVEVECRPS